MAKLKTHFEQIPVKVVKKIAQPEVSQEKGKDGEVTASLPVKKS